MLKNSLKIMSTNVSYYSFDNQNARTQILSEFIQSFTVALNSLSTTHIEFLNYPHMQTEFQ